MSSDSNKRPPQPSGDKKSGKNPKPPPTDSESIGFTHREATDEVAGSGPRSGSSIVSWNELAGNKSPADDIGIGDSVPAVEFDAASDHDLLREVLAGEKPPSGIILKEPSAPEIKIAPFPAHDDESSNALGGLEEVDIPLPVDISSRKMPTPPRTVSEAAFELPPEIEAEAHRSMAARQSNPRVAPVDDDDDASFFARPDPDSPDNSSILGALSSGPASGLNPGAGAEGSRVDLLGHLRKPDGSSGSSQSFEAPDAPVRRPHPTSIQDDDDESLLLGRSLDDDDDDESSAVDLGARPISDATFPLGFGSSSVNEPAIRSKTRSRGSRDSASVDLAGSSHEFNPDRHPGASSVDPNQFSGTDAELPPTTPIAVSSGNRSIAWAGGGAAGLAAGVLLCAGLWYADLVPMAKSDVGKPIPQAAVSGTPVVAANDAELKQALEKTQERATKAEGEFKGLNAALRKAGLDGAKLGQVAQKIAASEEAAKQAQAKYDEAVAKLNDAQRNPGDNKDAKAQIDALNEQLQKAKEAYATLAATNKKFEDARRSADMTHQATLAKLQETRDQAEQAAARAKDAEDRLASAAPSRELAKAIAGKLAAAGLVAAAARPDELLAGLDKALAKPGAAPPPASRPTAESAERLFAAGLRAYRKSDYANAEKSLADAVRANDQDARPRYVLALVRYRLGRPDESDADFRAAAALERQYLPPPRDIDDLIQRFSTQDRAVLSRHRP